MPRFAIRQNQQETIEFTADVSSYNWVVGHVYNVVTKSLLELLTRFKTFPTLVWYLKSVWNWPIVEKQICTSFWGIFFLCRPHITIQLSISCFLLIWQSWCNTNFKYFGLLCSTGKQKKKMKWLNGCKFICEKKSQGRV